MEYLAPSLKKYQSYSSAKLVRTLLEDDPTLLALLLYYRIDSAEKLIDEQKLSDKFEEKCKIAVDLLEKKEAKVAIWRN